MATPANSVLNRNASDSELFSSVVYENESLKIQVASLEEKLQSTGLLKLETLRGENEVLKSEVEKLRLQLAEKTQQLEEHRASNDHFANIDSSLSELLSQIRTQRTELAELKDALRAKDASIARLEEQLQEIEGEKEKALAQLREERDRTAQLGQVTDEMKTLQRTSAQEIGDLQKALKIANEELLSLKEGAVAESKSRARNGNEQAQVEAERDEREAAAQRCIIELQARMEILRSECSQLRESNTDMLRAQERQAHAEALITRNIDLNAPEVKAHVEKAVQRATEGVERRLQEQVDQNASLLSRMALIQKESEAMMQKKGMSDRDMTVMKERVDMRSRWKGALNSMQRRVAEVLSCEVLSKQSIQLLLQEMLDYQEETEKETLTLLLIKDIEWEERERVLQKEIEKLNEGNASLMKQLQELAAEDYQRQRDRNRTSFSGGTTGDVSTSWPSPHQLSSEATPNKHTTFPTPPDAQYLPQDNEKAGVSSGRTPGASSSPYQASDAHQVGQAFVTAPQQPHFGGDLWSHKATRSDAAPYPTQNQPTASHADPQMGLPYPHRTAIDHTGSSCGVDPQAVVRCPACTFEQPYANRSCTICGAKLIPKGVAATR